MTKQLYLVQYKNASYFLLSTEQHMTFLKSHQPNMSYTLISMTDEDELINCCLDIV